MVRIISALLLILLPTLCLAWGTFPGQSDNVVVAAGGDSCTGTLLFSAHFENNDDVTSGTPAGCSVSDTTITKAGWTYSSTQASDGTYSLYSTLENNTGVIDSTSMDVSTTGTWCADIYYSTAVDTRLFDLGGPLGRIYYGASNTSTLRTSYAAAANSVLSTDYLSDNTWTRLCFSWDLSPANGSRLLATKVGSNAWEESASLTFTVETNPTTYSIIGVAWQKSPGYVDNLKLYTDYQHAE